jgi:hypothetical protein
MIGFSDGSGTQNLGFGFWKCHGEMGLRQGAQGYYSSFFAKFITYLMIFDQWPKIWQKMKKSLTQIALKSICLADSGYPKIRFRVPDLSLEAV